MDADKLARISKLQLVWLACTEYAGVNNLLLAYGVLGG